MKKKNRSFKAVPGGLDRSFGIDVSLDMVNVHVRGVLELGRKSVVLENDGLEDILEVLVRVLVTGVDATVLVVELDGTGDGFRQGES